ncbi:MAG: hypothetical protein H6715_06660 [Myxococcales bacterium]|nr:hypothetical protein [Myxococcales bacterium]MCB9708229.1 hypothetical protein [Myxococcales bacterium]
MICQINLGVMMALMGVVALNSSAAAEAGNQAKKQGQLDCAVEDNGAPGSGTMVLMRAGNDVIQTSCGKPMSVNPGKYKVSLRLDGALDRPEKTMQAVVGAGTTRVLRAKFETGVLECHATVQGRRAAALAIISQDGQRVGSLGMGVTGKLSSGTYEVTIRHRNEEKVFNAVKVTQSERRVLDAAF